VLACAVKLEYKGFVQNNPEVYAGSRTIFSKGNKLGIVQKVNSCRMKGVVLVLPPFAYYQPETLAEAVNLLAELPEPKKVLAGGTDILPAMRKGELTAEHLVSLQRLTELSQIELWDGNVRIGALVTFRELATSPLIQKACNLLAEAAASVGGPQVRNQGTIGGNIVNASPAGDLLPPLFALEAQVRVCRRGGERILPLSEFLLGMGKTLILPEEILTGVIFPALPERAAGSFVKLGRRNSLAISRISMAAVITRTPDGDIEDARLVLGASAPRPVRAPAAEALLRGKYPGPALLEQVVASIAETVAAILGDRPSAPYKRVAVKGVARQALLKVVPEFGQWN